MCAVICVVSLAGLAPLSTATAHPVGRVSSALLPAPPATVPPELKALEEKMAAVHFNTEHFRLTIEFSLGSGTLGLAPAMAETLAASGQAQREGSWLTLTSSGQGSLSVSPPTAEFSVKSQGSNTEVRTIGRTVYEYLPAFSSIDHHRPWVSHTTPSPHPLGSTSEGLSSGTAAEGRGSFAALITLLGKAQRIEQVGLDTIEGQQTTAFNAHFNLADLVSGKRATKELEQLSKGGISTATLELFINSGGLPVRETLTLGGEGFSESISTDVLALEVPVHVVGPPARKTITKKRLVRLLKHHPVCFRIPARAHHRSRRICEHLILTSGESGSEAPNVVEAG